MNPNDMSFRGGVGSSALAPVTSSLWFFWSVFWKVAAATTAVLVLSFFGLHHDELSRPFFDVAVEVVVIFSYCMFYGFWVGIVAGGFALACRWCGAWILVPIVGAVLGAIAAVALALFQLRDMDLRGGLHGGGEIAAILVLGCLAASAVVGAIGGSVLTGIPALLWALKARRGRGAHTAVVPAENNPPS